MVTVRRTYVYLVSGISLIALIFALINLIQGLVPPGATPGAGTLALEIAIVVIALPFFLVHWLWARRSTQSDAEERPSFVRRLYLYAVLSVFLGAFVYYAYDLVLALLQQLLNVTSFSLSSPFERVVNSAIAMLILMPLWLYHHLTTRSDERAAPGSEMNASVRRLYILAFSGAGLVLTTAGCAESLRWLFYQFGGPALLDAAAPVEPPVSAMAQIIAGVPLWLVFWLWDQRLFASTDEGERASTLRKLYLYLTIFLSALGAVIGVTAALQVIIRGMLALPPSGDIRGSLAAAIPLAVVWAYHWMVLRRDAAMAQEGILQAGIRRLYHYLVAALGLAAVLLSLAGVVSVLIRALAGDPFGPSLREPLAWFTAGLIAGLPVWLLPWRSAQVGADREGPAGAEERRSIVRKLYLYFFLFAASMTVLGSAVYIAQRLLSLALGQPNQGNLAADLGQPIAYSLIAVTVWLYHGAVLRGDGRAIQRERAEQLAKYRVAVVDAEQGEWGHALVDELHREMPALTVVPIGLTQAAREAMGGGTEQALAERLADVRLIVGRWTMASALSSAMTPDVVNTLNASPARKLLVPGSAEGWGWIGIDASNQRALLNQATHTVKQLVDGEQVRPGRGLHPAAAIILALAGLCIALQVVSALMNVLFRPY